MTSDSRRAFEVNVRFEVGTPSKEVTSTTAGGETLVASGGGTSQIAVPAQYIVGLSYYLAMGTTGLGPNQQPIHDCGSHQGSIILHLLSNDQVAWGLLSVIGVGAELVFSFHSEGEDNPPEYRTVVTKPSFKLQADGVIATYEFHSVSVFDARLAKLRPSLKIPTEVTKLVEASRTWRPVLSAEVKRQAPLSPQEISSGISEVTGIALVRQERLFPHEVFEAIAEVCGWKTVGTFHGYRGLSTVQKSVFPVTDVTEWPRNVPIDVWITNHLIPICRTTDNYYYTLTFTPDDTGETVARFHSKNFDITRQRTVNADDSEFPVISYGSTVSDSEVIDCDIDVDTLSAALASSGVFVGSMSNLGTPSVDDSVRKTGYLGESDNKAGSLSVPGSDALVRPLPGRTIEEFSASVAQAATLQATGLVVNLTVYGTTRYLPGQFVRFTYSLPNGEDFLGVGNLTYQILGVLHRVGGQGYTTALTLSAIRLPDKSPVSDATPAPTDVPQAAQVLVPLSLTEKIVQNGFSSAILESSGTKSGSEEIITRFVQGTSSVKVVDPQGNRRIDTNVPGFTKPVTNIQIQPAPNIDTFSENPAE